MSKAPRKAPENAHDSNELRIEHVPISVLRPNPRNARTHSRDQVRAIARSIEEFGFTNPILTTEDYVVLAGHGRLEAAKLIGLKAVPVLRLCHLGEAERRAYSIADNKLALRAGWDLEILTSDLQELADLEFDLELTGFEVAEIDILFANRAEQESDAAVTEDPVPEGSSDASTTIDGDMWRLGDHILLCGDARHPTAYGSLLGMELADVIFTDPPYNVPTKGHIGVSVVR